MVLNSTVEVSNILSRCSHLPTDVSIRPDLTLNERHIRGILLKERRHLIDGGVPRDIIKIKRTRLYVSGSFDGNVIDNALIGNVANNAFVL